MTNEAREIMSRAEARALGLRRFSTGKPCRNGLVAERLTSNGRCLCEACSASHREREKLRAAANPEAVSAYQRRYYVDNADRVRARASAWAAANKARKSTADRDWRLRNPERKLGSDRAWAQQNKDRIAIRNALRRRRVRAATPGWFGEFDRFVIEEAHAAARRRTAANGFEWEVDHMVPLKCPTACGLHVAANIQVIPKAANRAKANRLIYTEPLQWLDFYDGR